MQPLGIAYKTIFVRALTSLSPSGHSMNRELVGLRSEIGGLVVVLLTTIRQGAFTDWFDKNSREWIAYARKSVNLAVLLAINDLSGQIDETDPDKRRQQRMQVYDRTTAAITEAIRERERRTSLIKGQAKMFSTIRYAMLLIGAALILAGNGWLLHTSAMRQPKRPNPSLQPTFYRWLRHLPRAAELKR